MVTLAHPGGESIRATLLVLAFGTVAWCFSEPLFWARLAGEGNGPLDAALTWSLYCAVTYLALVAARAFGARGWAGLFLVGAIVGWTVEGAVVAELYGGLPLSIVWTSLAWHATLTVGVGWLLLPKLLRRGGWRAWAMCTVGGLVWATWSIDPQLDEDVATLTGLRFVALVFGVVALLAAAYVVVWHVTPRTDQRSSRRVVWFVGLVVAAWAVPVTFVPVPFAAPMLAVLLGLVVWALRRLGGVNGRAEILDGRSIGVPLRATAPLSATVLAASVAHLVFDATGVELPTVAMVVTATTVAATGFLVWAFRLAVRAGPGSAGQWRSPRRSPSEP